MARTTKDTILHACKECRHATDWQNKAIDGHYILCRCKYHKYLRFLNRDGCNEHFIPK